jgi:hypothetical protein
VPIQLYKQVKITKIKKRYYVACKGLRYKDRLIKARRVVSTCPLLGVSSATFIYIIIIAILKDFTRRSKN